MASSTNDPPADHALSLLDDEARLVREFFAAARRCAAPDEPEEGSEARSGGTRPFAGSPSTPTRRPAPTRPRRAPRRRSAQGAQVAFVVGPGFEDAQLRIPRERLERAGHEVTLLGPKAGAEVVGLRGELRARVDAAAASGDPDAFDALVIPGGQSPDHLCADPEVVAFVRRFHASGRPVAALGQGTRLLIEADETVVADGPLITSRHPDDLEAFANTLLAAL